MANEDHLKILKQGVVAWNKWINSNRHLRPELSMGDLSGLDLHGVQLIRANLGSANLSRANLSEAKMSGADLGWADLREATLHKADLRRSNLNGAKLIGTDLRSARLYMANLSRANFSGSEMTNADLRSAILVQTDLSGANLTGCYIFGISAWELILNNTIQSNLSISKYGETSISVDNLEVAQFVYLLLHNEKIRDVIATIGRKAVLILGRFALPERKEILDAMREFLREKGFLPIVFDFEKSEERDFTETIKTLAGISLFVIADITNPKSSLLELQATVTDYMIPFAPIIQAGERPFAMFVDLQHKYRGVLDVREYNDMEHLLSNFENGVVKPAIAKHNELLVLKNEGLKIRSIDKY